MVQKTSAKKVLGAVAILGFGLVSLAGCSNGSSSASLSTSPSPSASHTPQVVHASASPSPAPLSAAVAKIVSATNSGDYIVNSISSKGDVVSTVAHATTPISGINWVAFDAASAKYVTAVSPSGSAAFASAHPTILNAVLAQLNAGKCTRVLTTKAGFLAVCGGSTSFDIAVKSGKVARIYQSVRTGKTSVRSQFLVEAGWSANLKSLFAAATKK